MYRHICFLKQIQAGRFLHLVISLWHLVKNVSIIHTHETFVLWTFNILRLRLVPYGISLRYQTADVPSVTIVCDGILRNPYRADEYQNLKLWSLEFFGRHCKCFPINLVTSVFSKSIKSAIAIAIFSCYEMCGRIYITEMLFQWNEGRAGFWPDTDKITDLSMLQSIDLVTTEHNTPWQTCRHRLQLFTLKSKLQG